METQSQEYDRPILLNRITRHYKKQTGQDMLPLQRARISQICFADLKELVIELEFMDLKLPPIGGANGLVESKIAKSITDHQATIG